ncbi:MAG: LEA type 2 family protein [Bacteroidetes bacterium]|uniref:LEA type 2 family protein n=1 Tax=Phnomibacter sp. TaxID=2836217 RepID=UPI002FDE3B08|nr:LEA type 2 family protein [Bacteroidota bacterium]
MQKIFIIATLLLQLAACKVPQALQYSSISTIQVQSIDLKNTDGVVELSFYNPNAFAVQLNRVEAILSINNQVAGKANMDTLIQMPGLANSSLPVRIQLGNQLLLGQSMKLLLGGSIPYQIEGFAMAGKKKPRWKIPFSQRGAFTRQMLEKLFR